MLGQTTVSIRAEAGAAVDAAAASEAILAARVERGVSAHAGPDTLTFEVESRRTGIAQDLRASAIAAIEADGADPDLARAGLREERVVTEVLALCAQGKQLAAVEALQRLGAKAKSSPTYPKLPMHWGSRYG